MDGPILIDANTLISGIIFGGNELKLLKVAGEEPQLLVISEDIVWEFHRVIERKFPELQKVSRVLFENLGLRVIPHEHYRDKISAHTVVRDLDDRHLLACATEANCEALVTGDHDLLILAPKYKGVKILRTVQALKLLQESNPA